VETRDSSLSPDRIASSPRGGLRFARHAVALLLAAALAWLVFAAYRQPDFILDFAGMRLC